MRARRKLGFALAVAGLALTAACSGPAETDDTSSKTRTVTDVTDTKVEVLAAPKRVVTLSEQDLDATLALGITPVGTINGRGQDGPPAYLGDEADGIESVGDVGKPTTDKIVELEPDLVLYGGYSDEEQLEQIRELVPATVVTYELEEDWKVAFDRAADALGKADEAKSWMSDYDKRTEEVSGQLGDNSDATISIVRWNPDGPGILLHEAFSSLVIQDLGLERPESQQEPGFAHTDPLSLENLPRIDGDWMFLGTLVPGSEAALEEARESPAYSKLEVVKDDHVVEIDGTLWTSRGGPLGALKVIDDVEANLAE